MKVWIWQQMMTPHMVPLAEALAREGVAVRFLAMEDMSPDRAAQGWEARQPAGVEAAIIENNAALADAIAQAPSDAVHLTQGIVRNGLIGVAQRLLASRGARIWWMAEKVDRRGPLGWLKTIDYRRAISRRSGEAERLLAIGDGCAQFMAHCGFPAKNISPFAYFLEPAMADESAAEDAPFTIVFAARMIGLKRFDLLVEALDQIDAPFRLVVLGDGPLAEKWKALAIGRLDGRVDWIGGVSPKQVRGHLAQSDLLVLPSDYDGWGAVASEALIEGTRVIASDACGASIVVREEGALFPSGDAAALAKCIETSLHDGKVASKERTRRRAWAQCLDARIGARYLIDLLKGRDAPAPWLLGPSAKELAA